MIEKCANSMDALPVLSDGFSGRMRAHARAHGRYTRRRCAIAHGIQCTNGPMWKIPGRSVRVHPNTNTPHASGAAFDLVRVPCCLSSHRNQFMNYIYSTYNISNCITCCTRISDTFYSISAVVHAFFFHMFAPSFSHLSIRFSGFFFYFISICILHLVTSLLEHRCSTAPSLRKKTRTIRFAANGQDDDDDRDGTQR